MRRLYYLLPIIAFGVLTYFLFGSLHAPPPDQLPSPLVGKPAPSLATPPLDNKAAGFSRSDLAAGHADLRRARTRPPVRPCPTFG